MESNQRLNLNLLNENSKYLLNSNGLQLYSVEWYPTNNKVKAIVYICYGYAEHMHSGYFDSLAVPLNEIGCLVSGHDYQGHGQSQGKRGHFDSLDQIIDDVMIHINILKNNYSNIPFFILGYSFGGIIAILSVIKHPKLFQGIILESPALDFNCNMKNSLMICIGSCLSLLCPCIVIKRFSDELSKSDKLRIQNLKAGTAIFLLKSIITIKKELSKITIPILAVHGELDDIIPYHATVNLINKSSSMDKSMKIYSHTKHDIRYDNETDYFSYLNELKRWILSRI